MNDQPARNFAPHAEKPSHPLADLNYPAYFHAFTTARSFKGAHENPVGPPWAFYWVGWRVSVGLGPYSAFELAGACAFTVGVFCYFIAE